MIIKLIGKTTLFLFTLVIAYYIASTIIGGFVAFAFWDYTILSDAWTFWKTPEHVPVVRGVSIYLAIGISAVEIKEVQP
jgi:hypothetical protein